jgi:predicted phage tail protein
MALTWALLVSMDSLGASVLGVLPVLAVFAAVVGAATGFFLASLTSLALLISFFAAAGLAALASGAWSTYPAAPVLAPLSASLFAAAAGCSLSLRGSASEVVKFLSKDEPLVTISF